MLDELCGLVVPSKVYGVVAAARPCIFLGPEGSEAAKFLAENRCGVVLPEAGGNELAAAIERWITESADLEYVRQNASVAAQLVTAPRALAAFRRIIFQTCGAEFGPDVPASSGPLRSFRRESAPVLASIGAGESSRRDL